MGTREQKYRLDWEKDEFLKNLLTHFNVNGKLYPYCTKCEKNISCKYSALVSHEQSKEHSNHDETMY